MEVQYGKLSDIYGRAPLLLASYLFLSLGCVIWYAILFLKANRAYVLISYRISSGLSHNMDLVIIGRIMSGVGGAGVMALSSIIITGMLKYTGALSFGGY